MASIVLKGDNRILSETANRGIKSSGDLEISGSGSLDIIIDYEKSVILTPQTKYVRLDVLFEGDDTWYDLEMQCENEGNIPKRTRYIHGIMDAQA